MLKVIKIHERIIAQSQQFIEFIRKVPLNKLIALICHTRPINDSAFSHMGRKEDIHCVCKVIGFNKESIRIRLIAVEKIFYPLNCIEWSISQGRETTDLHIKMRDIKNFTWKEINKKDLPLYINYELKTCLFDAMLKGKHQK